jgi:hypothetical protein
MSRRGRLGFVAACLLVFGLLAAWVLSSPSLSPFGRSRAPVTLAPGATQPARLTVTDLNSVEQLQARFNADKGAPRLVLALAPT